VRQAGLSNLKSHRVNRDDRLRQVSENGNLREFPHGNRVAHGECFFKDLDRRFIVA